MRLGWGAEAVGKLLKLSSEASELRPKPRTRWQRGKKKESHHFISPGPGSQESQGYHACQELRSLITEETLSYFFFGRLIGNPQISQPICQLPVQTAAESANEWVSEDLPTGLSVITPSATAGPTAATLIKYQSRFTMRVGDRDHSETHRLKY